MCDIEMAVCVTYSRMPHKTGYMGGIEMAVCVNYECHMQTYISGGLVAGLHYLQCVSDGDAAVLHPAIDIMQGRCPGASLASGRCLHL